MLQISSVQKTSRFTMSLLVARCCCLAVVLTITLYLCLRETSLAREVLPYPRGGNRKQAACTQRVQGSAIQRSKITTMAEPQQEHQRPADATEFFSQLGDMEDAGAIANSQRLNTLAAWAPTEWMKVKDLDGAMKITAFAFENLEEPEDRDSLRRASKQLMNEERGGPTEIELENARTK